MEDLKKYYRTEVDKTNKILSTFKTRRNVITTLKVASFIMIFFEIYKYAITIESIYIIIGVLMVAIFIICSLIDTKIANKITFLKALIKSFSIEIEYLNGDYSNLSTGEQYIDSTHEYSADLDVFGQESLYQVINRTVTDNGSKKLALSLLNPCNDTTELNARRLATKELIEKNIWCHNFLATGKQHHISSIDADKIDSWKSQKIFLNKKWHKYILLSVNILMAVMIVAAFFISNLSTAVTIIFFINLITTILMTKRISKVHNELGEFTKAMGNYFYLIKEIKAESFSSPLLKGMENDLFENKNSLKIFSQLQKILDSLDGRFNLLVIIFLNGLYLRDLHTIIELNKWKERYADDILNWTEHISKLDMLISMANFRFNNPTYSEPKIDNDFILSASCMGHPMLRTSKMITNDFHINNLHNLYIVTGANMAGKSTFLRAVGINMVLALSGNVVCAKEFSCAPMELFSSMRTTDNLSKGTSYFHAELLRLKALINKASSGKNVFIILDEMLKGTNSVDKLNGSRRFLIRLLSLPVSGLVATHDLELGKLSSEYPDNFFNVCFEIEHSKEDIVYDYKLKSGVSKNMNASILLENMGLV